MKKTIYFFGIAAALGLGFSACSSDDLALETVGGATDGTTGRGGQNVVFCCRMADELEILDEEGDGGATRSVIDGGQITGWTVGDAVTISDGMLSYAYEVKEGAGTGCLFGVREGGNAFLTESTTADETFYAFYPEKAVTDAAGRGGWNGSTVKAMIFTEQDNTENVNGGTFGAYMASEGATMDETGKVFFTFHLAASVIDVNLSALGVTPKTVSILSNKGETLAGLLKYNCAAQSITVSTTDATGYAASTQSDVVTVGNIAADATVARFYVLPVQLAEGVTVTVQDTEGNFYTKTTSSAIGTITEGAASISGATGTACKPYYKKLNFGAASSATRKNNWMATLPGNVPFCQLSIPGAHDAATEGCTLSSAKGQSKTIAEQLAGGVRGFDLRPRFNSSSSSDTDIQLANLEIYHGAAATGVLFKDAMQTLVDFVTANPTEALYVRIKKEDSKLLTSLNDYSSTWRTSIRTCLGGHYDAGHVLGKITAGITLAECRGKLVITVDNPYGEEGNVENTVYGGRMGQTDNTTGESHVINHTWSSWVANAYVQDWYDSSDTGTKVNTYVANTLSLSSGDSGNTWYFNYLNLANSPATYAKTVNPGVVTLLGNTTGRAGIVMYDYCLDNSYGGLDLYKAIVAQNYKYVAQSRSRLVRAGNTGASASGDEKADDSEVYIKAQ